MPGVFVKCRYLLNPERGPDNLRLSSFDEAIVDRNGAEFKYESRSFSGLSSGWFMVHDTVTGRVVTQMTMSNFWMFVQPSNEQALTLWPRR
jgi:hypothetical protein